MKCSDFEDRKTEQLLIICRKFAIGQILMQLNFAIGFYLEFEANKTGKK